MSGIWRKDRRVVWAFFPEIIINIIRKISFNFGTWANISSVPTITVGGFLASLESPSVVCEVWFSLIYVWEHLSGSSEPINGSFCQRLTSGVLGLHRIVRRVSLRECRIRSTHAGDNEQLEGIMKSKLVLRMRDIYHLRGRKLLIFSRNLLTKIQSIFYSLPSPYFFNTKNPFPKDVLLFVLWIEIGGNFSWVTHANLRVFTDVNGGYFPHPWHGVKCPSISSKRDPKGTKQRYKREKTR